MCNKKNKIAFVCSTYVQIMRMFQIKKEIPEFYGKADLYLVHDMFNNMEFIRRLENTNEFDNVFYFNVNEYKSIKTSVYKGYKQDKIEMRGDRAEMSDFPLYLNTVAGGLDRRDQTIGGFSFVVKIYAVPVVEIIG